MDPHSPEVIALVLTPAARAQVPIRGAPTLSHASGELLREIEILDEYADHRRILLPVERPLLVRVDEHPLATLWSLGANAEWLVLGYLWNQQLLTDVTHLESITIDWGSGSALVKTRSGAPLVGVPGAPAPHCSPSNLQGSPLQDSSRIARSRLLSMLAKVPRDNTIYRAAGSVHGCALFAGGELLIGVEDVSRRNTFDIIAGWMALHGVPGDDKALFTTGRLTSEILLKAARSGIRCLIARKGVTAGCCDLAGQLGMTLFGHAAQGRYICYAGLARFDPSA